MLCAFVLNVTDSCILDVKRIGSAVLWISTISERVNLRKIELRIQRFSSFGLRLEIDIGDTTWDL